MRDVAPRFENRLFLSATPHNGHSNSFSSLLELLDPQRFTRGVPVAGKDQLNEVMVRRLKSDLRELGSDQFPKRSIVQIDLVNEGGSWQGRFGEDAPIVPLGDSEPVELKLATQLEEYTALMKPKRGRGKLPFINLQKRLLSSIEAFNRTLERHRRGVQSGKAKTALKLDFRYGDPSDRDADEYGVDDDAAEEADLAMVEEGSHGLTSPEGRAKELLESMAALASSNANAPDAKVLALLEWIRKHQCPGAAIGAAEGKGAQSKDKGWTNTRLLIFTEYGDTKRYLWQLLSAAIQGTDRADERILQFHGGMSDDQREDVQTKFNGAPEKYPVRILLATDAAREGVNLQGHCADLLHFDLPWNPARMEQRNGRIDRTLQPAKEVRCMYFYYPQRTEDLVLKKIVAKVDVIQHELGSLGGVVMDRLADAMSQGIDDSTSAALDEAETLGGRKQLVERELEAQRNIEALREESDELDALLEKSRRALDYDPALLRDALDIGLELSGAPALTPRPSSGKQSEALYDLPAMPDSWQRTLDTLRTPRGRDEPPWEWRKHPLLPVVFRAPDRLASDLVHLHLEHPFVQRMLGRFRSQGFSAHDLSRVTIVRTRRDNIARVIAFGRLSLFGPGASRLHDELIAVTAQWLEGKGEAHLRPSGDRAEALALENLEQMLSDSPTLEGVGEATRARLLQSAPGDFAKLWDYVKADAESRAHDAVQQLTRRGHKEAGELRRIITTQRDAIKKTLGGEQLSLVFKEKETAQKEQLEQDRQHMDRRLKLIERELETEPPAIEELYQVVLRRVEPVGLVYLWPQTKG